MCVCVSSFATPVAERTPLSSPLHHRQLNQYPPPGLSSLDVRLDGASLASGPSLAPCPPRAAAAARHGRVTDCPSLSCASLSLAPHVLVRYCLSVRWSCVRVCGWACLSVTLCFAPFLRCEVLCCAATCTTHDTMTPLLLRVQVQLALSRHATPCSPCVASLRTRLPEVRRHAGRTAVYSESARASHQQSARSLAPQTRRGALCSVPHTAAISPHHLATHTHPAASPDSP